MTQSQSPILMSGAMVRAVLREIENIGRFLVGSADAS